jgi:hypothetical protein
MNRASPAHIHAAGWVGGEEANPRSFEPTAKRNLLLIAAA